MIGKLACFMGRTARPIFSTDEDIETFFESSWEVHYNSSRTGVRLVGPKPVWAREDGGEAGLHPSNIHDNAYAIGSVDFTGDTPVILGPDGPSLGGFVCPVVVVEAELWKIGQLRPGDRIRFVPISPEDSTRRRALQDAQLTQIDKSSTRLPSLVAVAPANAVLETRAATIENPQVVYRQAGDDNLLVEYGPVVLDLDLRFRVHALMTWLQNQNVRGIIDLTPGIRSLQLHFDSRTVSRAAILELLRRGEAQIPNLDDMEVPTRIVHLPLSWDDPSVRLAIQKYQQSVRADAPWCPSNIEFIRRINGLESVEQVRRIVFDANYLVLGLGDVYLGAPVATPLDPRHRLVTTKYNPARTWTPQSAVGIGGAYMCIYGLEGPGGYQLVGRTLPIWNTYRSTPDFEAGKPWLLRFFDQVRYYPVQHDELLQLREDFRAGQFSLQIEEETFRLSDYHEFLSQNADSIAAFKSTQQAAFNEEREQWRINGQADYVSEADSSTPPPEENELPEGALSVDAPTAGVVWKINVQEGETVRKDDVLLIVEIMKTEFALSSPCDGRVLDLKCSETQMISAGQRLVVVMPS